MSRDSSLDPLDLPDGGSEYDYGPGMFAPGIANGEGQRRQQDDFGQNMFPPMFRDQAGHHDDNYARAVADRRTDSTDPESGRSFDTCGNTDRFGAAPPLVRADPEPNRNQRVELPKAKTVRRW